MCLDRLRANRYGGTSIDMDRRLIAEGFSTASSSEFLIRELRESAPYLADEGWHQVARLMLVAADEIEQLHARIDELDGINGHKKLRTIPVAARRRAVSTRIRQPE